MNYISYLYIVKERVTKLNLNKGFMSKLNKYPNGYQPKINFWQERYDQAKSDNDLSTMNYCLDKLIYFVKRQREVYA